MVLLTAEGFAWSSLLLGERLVYSYLNNGAVREQTASKACLSQKGWIFFLSNCGRFAGGPTDEV